MVMRLNCNAVEFDRHIKTPHLLEVIANMSMIMHAQHFKWEKIILNDPTNFQVMLTDLNNTPANVKQDGSHMLLIFRKQ